MFRGFGQPKFAYGGLIFGWNQFALLPQLPLKTTLDLKVVKIDSKIIISLSWSDVVSAVKFIRVSSYVEFPFNL